MAESGNTRFGKLLRSFRARAGLNQAALAERAGLSVRGISDLERGLKGRPYFETIRRLAEALELSEGERAALLAAARPPVPGRTAPRPRLPAPLTSFIGREAEVKKVAALLRDEKARLVTLTGPGGVGKTRLAIQVANELAADYADGVWFVGLAPIADPALVVSTIAAGLELHEALDRPLSVQLRDHLIDRELLLVLDNVEHVTEVGTLIADLLTACPRLSVLLTSRVRLRLYGEHEFAVPTLTRPDPRQQLPLQHLRRYDAVRLFVARARALIPDFAVDETNGRAVAAICHHLDGLPLAIELAAARVRILPPPAMTERLERRLTVLTGGARNLPARHQTMRAAIAWSYDLLPADRQDLFRRLAVFAGGSTVEAAEALRDAPSTLDGIEELLDHNLLRRVEVAPGEIRLTMLETLREYGLEALADSGDVEATRRRHLAIYLDLAERAEPTLAGTAQTEEGFDGPDQATWLSRLERDHDNLRSALAWAIDHDPAAAVRLGGALWRFWIYGNHFSEGRDWLDRVLCVSADIRSVARVKALDGLGLLARALGDNATALGLLNESLALARDLGDGRGAGNALNDLGGVHAVCGHLDRALAFCTEALEIFRAAGDRRGMADARINLVEIAVRQENWPAAIEAGEALLAFARTIHDSMLVANALANLALSLRMTGDRTRARALFREAIAVVHELGFHYGLAWSVCAAGGLVIDAGQAAAGARLLAAGEAHHQALGVSMDPAERARFEQDAAAARAVLGEAAFASAWTAGAGLTVDEAVAEAMGALAGDL